MTSYSGYLTNYLGGSFTQPGGTMKDVMSNVILVPTRNNTNHTTDGFLFFNGLLIQFSATTTFSGQISAGSTSTLTFPIAYENSGDIYNILLSEASTGTNNPIVSLNAVPTATSFQIAVRTNLGNAMWISIGIAPSIPEYLLVSTAANAFPWVDVACSGDGHYIIGGSSSGSQIRISNEYGYGYNGAYPTWGSVGTSRSWRSFAVNSNGQYMAAVSNTTAYDYSVNYGVTWTAVSPSSTTFNSIAINSSGSQLIAAADAGVYIANLQTPTNLSLIASSPINAKCIASDSTGQYLALGTTTFIHTSSNNGTTWTQQNNASGSWIHIVSNSTGQILVAIKTTSDFIYISSNYGVNWSTIASSRSWASVAIDYSGKYIKAVSSVNGTEGTGVGPYYSNDYGSTWTQLTASSISNLTYGWTGVACSSSGAFSVIVSTSHSPYVSFNASA